MTLNTVPRLPIDAETQRLKLSGGTLTFPAMLPDSDLLPLDPRIKISTLARYYRYYLNLEQKRTTVKILELPVLRVS